MPRSNLRHSARRLGQAASIGTLSASKPLRNHTQSPVAQVVGMGIIMAARLSGGVGLYGLILCGIAAVALAAATLAVGRVAGKGNLLMIVSLQMFLGALVLIVVAMATETLRVTMSWQLVLAFSYTTLMPGLLATWIWFKLVERIGPVRAATFHFLNPFFGVAIAALFLHEKLGGGDILGVAIIAGGILAVQLSKQPKQT